MLLYNEYSLPSTQLLSDQELKEVNFGVYFEYNTYYRISSYTPQTHATQIILTI